MGAGLKVFLGFLILRIASIFVVKSWYVPDEYWQSLEVAHKLAFGYGHLTWEWKQGIRSYILPGLIALIYKALEYFGLDQVNFLVLAPRILQALLSAFADYRFYKWTGDKKWSIFVISTSWFWFYTATRTLSNTVETALTTIALSYFPWWGRGNAKFLWIVSLACFLRPTTAIIWVPLCLFHLTKSKSSFWSLLLKEYLPIGALTAGLAIGVDSWFHGKLIITPFEFFKINVLHEIGSFYGSHNWYWYFSVGLPTILGIYVVPFILSIKETLSSLESYPIRKVLLISIGLSLGVYSFLPHKEFRFILPLLPMSLYITCDYLSRWSWKTNSGVLWLAAIGLLVFNSVPSYYLSTVHQRGVIDVMPVLSKLSQDYKVATGNHPKYLFLMPCHSTPFYSHIHANVTMRFLTCEPNLDNANNYMDEADEFYKDPGLWVRAHLPAYPKNALPTHLIMFDVLTPKLNDLLANYKEIHSIFHSEIETEKIGKKVLVFERDDRKKDPPQKEPERIVTQHEDSLDDF